MKKIGIIGGLSWESTALYYRLINEDVAAQLGGLHSAQVLINSLNFAEVVRKQKKAGWEELAKYLLNAAIDLQNAGAEYLFLGANTVHKVADTIAAGLEIPLVHIVDVVGEILTGMNFKQCGLLGTKYTMEEDFFKQRLKKNFTIDTMIPNTEERDFIHRVIYDELSQGIIDEDSKQRMIGIITRLQESGAPAVILGCTELGLLVGEDDVPVFIVDTAKAHAEKAVELMLEGEETK